jgi:hypothetical protein
MPAHIRAFDADIYGYCRDESHGRAIAENSEEMRTLSNHWLSEIPCSLFSAAAQYIQAALPVALFLVAGGGPKAAPAVPSPEVEVASVLQKDVPIFSEWVATLDGYINTQIQHQVAGLHGALSSGPRPGFVLPRFGSMDYVTPVRIGSGKTRHLVQCGGRVITRMSLASPWPN